MTRGSSETQRDLILSKAIAWLWDAERRRIVWASDGAVLFWQESTMLDLLERQFGADEPVVRTLQALAAGLNDDDWHRHALRFTPDAQAVWTQCRLKRHPLSADRFGLLIEVETIDEPAEDTALPLAATLADHAPAPLALFAIDGTVLAQNAACRDLFDDTTTFMARLKDAELAGKIILRVLAEGLYSRSLTVNTRYGPRLHRLTARRAHNPQTGAPALAVHFHDIHEQRQTWRTVMQAIRGLDGFAPPGSASRPAAVPEDHPPAAPVPAEKAPDAPFSSALSAFLDALPFGLLVISASGHIEQANPTALAVLKRHGFVRDHIRHPDDLAGRPFTELFTARQRQRLSVWFENAVPAGRHLERNGAVTCVFDGEVELKPGIALSLGAAHQNSGTKIFMIIRDITGQKEKEAALVQARDRAEATSARKSDFIAKLSHEMRTPLNAIIGFSEIMAEERLGPMENARYKDYARDIHASSGYLLNLVNDLLDMSKVEAGKLSLQPEEVDLGAAIKACTALVRPLAHRAKIAIHTTIDGHLPHVVADSRSIRQILLNLLSNAIKFSRAGDDIYVMARLNAAGAVELGVRDTGQGMTKKELAQALEVFGQTPAARAKESDDPATKGTGLGLPLARALTEANKALFHIESVPGRGTHIVITFPTTLVLAE